MDSDGYPRSWIIFAVILIYKGFCTVCESAVLETDRRKLRSCENSKRCRILADMTERPARLMTAFSVNRTLTGIIAAYLAMIFFLTPLSGALYGIIYGSADEKSLSVSPLTDVIAAFVIMLATVIVFTAFCEGIPKKIPAAKSEKFAVFCVPFISILVTALTPLTALSSLITRLFAPIFGAKSSSEPEIGRASCRERV